MNRTTLSFIALGLLAASSAFGQSAPAKTSPKAAAAKGNPAVDAVIEMVKSGLSEPFIIKKLVKDNHPIDLTPADMVKLKQAKVSENIMNVMMDPASAAAPAPAAPIAAAPSAALPTPPMPAASTTVAPTLTPTAAPSAQSLKKRAIIDPFDYSAVMTAVQSIFGSQQNIGKGIQAMLVTRVARDGKLVIVDRAKLSQVTQEQDFNKSNRVKQGTGARVGRISAADVILAGDIVIFGRDDKKKGGVASAAAGWCRLCGAVGASKKDEKAVVAIDYKLIDAETTEVIATGEARGESKRSGFNAGAFVASYWHGAGGGAVDMSSSNFAETIIGEATMDCVNKLAVILNEQGTAMTKTVREVEGLVADAAGNVLTINVGALDGVGANDVFDVLRVEREVKDPATHEVLDRITTKVGELTIATVRDKIAMGNYTGSPAAVGFVARKHVPAGQ